MPQRHKKNIGATVFRITLPAIAFWTSINTARSQSLLMPVRAIKTNYVVISKILQLKYAADRSTCLSPLITPSSPGRPDARWMCVLFIRLKP